MLKFYDVAKNNLFNTFVFKTIWCLPSLDTFKGGLGGLQIGVRQAPHAPHNTEDVVVGGVDGDHGAVTQYGLGLIGDLEVELGEVNTREVDGARGLVFLGVEGEGEQVDTIGGGVGVVLPGLDVVEVVAVALGEPVLAVELDVGFQGEVGGAVQVETEVPGLEHAHEAGGDGVVQGGVLVDEVGEHGRAGQHTDGGGDEVLGHRLPAVVEPLHHRQGVGAEDGGEGVVQFAVNGAFNLSLGGQEGGAVAELLNQGINGSVATAEGGKVSGTGIGGLHKERARLVHDFQGHEVQERGELLLHKLKVSGVVSHELFTGDVLAELHGPHDFLAGVVEGKADLPVLVGDAVFVGGLELLNQVLVGVGGETLALFTVKEHVVNDEDGIRDLGLDLQGGVVVLDDELIGALEVEVDAHIVVLEGNQGQGQTVVAVEPEIQGDVQGGALVVGGQLSKFGGVTNHLGVTLLLGSAVAQLVPDVHPLTQLAVNAGATNLDFYFLDHGVTKTAHESKVTGGVVESAEHDIGLEVDLGHEITVAGNQ